MQTRAVCALMIAVASLAGCARLADWTAPRKQASVTRSDAALAADKRFWETLHSGAYDDIGGALDAETGAYLADPRDDLTAAHVGWLHIWRLGERGRQQSLRPTVTDDMVLARRYFAEAVALNPKDARYQGFLAAATLGEGNINGDERLTRKGYFMLKDAIDAWPEFNLFTGGYVMSGLPADSKGYAEAVEWQWRNLDVCLDAKLDRAAPDLTPYLTKETTTGKKRVCWNSWIAPHNFEGFFLNMGDMVAKTGDWKTAQRLYANAKLSRTYGGWAYRDVLEQRIAQAEANVASFRKPAAQRLPGDTPMMFDSSYSCMACHQQSVAAAAGAG